MFFLWLVFCCLLNDEGVFSKPIADSSLGLNEVAYHNERSKIYLGSPSIVRLSSGRLLASHDFFGKGYNASVKNVTVYRSDDNGITWPMRSHIKPSFFTSLTVYEDRIYAIGVTGEHHSGIIIHRSIDQGLTWTYQNRTGGVVLFPGAFSSGATAIVLANNILYRSIEYRTVPGRWPEEFQAAMISCNLTSLTTNNVIDDDPIMNASNWRITSPLVFDQNWIPSSYPNLTSPGYLEGSVVILPKPNSSDIRVINVMRFNSIPLVNLAILLELNFTTNNLSFVSIIQFPGGMSKFTIRYDVITKTYLSLSNPVSSSFDVYQRNVLSLVYSKDLIDWNIAIEKLLYDDTGLQSNDSLRYTGFHYVDWQFDQKGNNGTCVQWNCYGGDDLIYLVRTAYRGANSYHNSNRITFKILPNFRKYLPQIA